MLSKRLTPRNVRRQRERHPRREKAGHAVDVGKLVNRCRLTVRTLHHDDASGLLTPTPRSAAGYRHYDRANIERLQDIPAVRQLGLSLADIGKILSGPRRPVVGVVNRQIAQIGRQRAKGFRLRERLEHLSKQRQARQSAKLADGLDTLRAMTRYERYFSPKELEERPLFNDRDLHAQWSAVRRMKMRTCKYSRCAGERCVGEVSPAMRTFSYG